MQHGSLKLLCCPACRGALSFEGKRDRILIREGKLVCQECNRVYPIEKNIPRFVRHEDLSGLNESFERAYNRLSHFYDSFFTRAYLGRRFWPSSGEIKARMEIIARLELCDGSSVLETSVGTGDNIPHLASNGHRVKVYGLDVSAGMLSRCVKNLRKWKCEAELFMGNAEELPFRDESFDAVFHVGGINFFTEKGKAVREMVRVARAGTRIVIVCETEKAIESNRIGIGLVFGRGLAGKMLKFRFRDVLAHVPENMSGISLSQIWEGNGYLLEFRKPSSSL